MPSRREGHTYTSTTGIDYGSVPFKLWDRSKQLFWDPADLDFTSDATDWAELTDAQRFALGGAARAFMVGEEAVTLDILPLLRAMSDLGRLEDTMYLAMFAMEEAKHVDFFRRWFDAVGFDPRFAEAGGGYGGSDGDADPYTGLQRVMRRLDDDPSPKRILDASLLYNHLIEAVYAIAGYRLWDEQFRALDDKLPALREGLQLVQRDERRHIAYGTYLCRRIVAEHPELWEWVEQRWQRMAGAVMDGPEPFVANLARRRLETIAVARAQDVADVERTAVADLEPDGLPESEAAAV